MSRANLAAPWRAVWPVLTLGPVWALGLWAFFWGNFAGSASALGAMASQLMLLTGLAASQIFWRRVGRVEAAFVALVWMAMAFAAAFSVVPRAGLCALALWPAFAILPRLTAYLFAGDIALRRASRALALLLLLVAAFSLGGVYLQGTPGASLPLGHHNLLAVFLLLLLPAPLALFSAGRRDRWLALFAGGLGLAALLATRSFGGAIGLLCLIVLALPWRRLPLRRALLSIGLVVSALVLAVLALTPRWLQLSEEIGLSSSARLFYLEAGWRGFLASPWVGHGPGSTPWLFAEYFVPQVGIHPPDHVVADLHCLPLQVLFELGLPGALVAVGYLLVLLLPLWRQGIPGDPFRAALVRSSRAGLVAALVFSFTGFLLAVPALPVAFLLLAGLAHAALGPQGELKDCRREGPFWSALPPLLALLLGLCLLPSWRAHFAWDRARLAADTGAAQQALEAALGFDPSFPLYRARLGVLRGDPALLAQAAHDGGAVGPLVLQAGLAAEDAGDVAAAAALLERACDLDPFGALAPFRLAVGPAGGDFELRVERAMRTLVAEPRLVASSAWLARPGVLLRAQARLDEEGAPPYWAAALLPSMERLFDPSPSRAANLVQMLDQEAAESVSLFVFRRSPWPVPLARVLLRVEALPEDLPPAVAEATMWADFAAPSCRWR